MNRQIQAGDNPLLTAERKRADFDTDELAKVYNGPQRLQRQREIFAYYSKHPELHDPEPVEFLDRVQKLENAERKVILYKKHLPQAVPDSNHEDSIHFAHLIFHNDGMPLGLHTVMGIPTILNNADDEQVKEWLPKARNLEFISTYAQTELGHGTNLRKLETTATYDPAKQEFVLHSPTITATKWWPGNLAKVSNFIVVVARLINNGKDHGPHPFFVQIRDPVTHKSMPGVTVGDIGPKFGINTTDNGFLRFDHVRIPRRAMFMKNAKMTPEGEYIPPVHSKLTYGTMVFVRSVMITGMAKNLAEAATIGIRYSSIRHQGEIEPQRGEVSVLEYQTQIYRMLPQVARAWAFEAAGRYTRQLYFEFLEEVNRGKADVLPDLHAITSGLKAVVTHQVCQGIEQCRMGCGGHGYSDASGLPQLYGFAMGGCTYEGENMVMLLQCARYLVKCAGFIRSNKKPEKVSPVAAYLYDDRRGQKCRINQDTDVDPESVLNAFEHVSKRLMFKAFDGLQQKQQEGKNKDRAWAECGVDLRRAATAHTRTFIARQFVHLVDDVTDLPSRAVLRDLLILYLFYEVLEMDGDLLFDGFASGQQIEFARNHVYSSLERLRPNCVSLVDSFDFTDRELNSVLGRRDGHVYENLFKWAQNSPLNKHDVLPFHHQYLGKMMQQAKSKI